MASTSWSQNPLYACNIPDFPTNGRELYSVCIIQILKPRQNHSSIKFSFCFLFGDCMNKRLLHDLLDDKSLWYDYSKTLKNKNIKSKAIPYYRNHEILDIQHLVLKHVPFNLQIKAGVPLSI